jgi:SAM-dependent methyltransferase
VPGEYDALADVYDWLVPAALATPEASAAAFLPYLEELPAGARVLDCAAGTGPVAVGLAQRGLHVVATDASAGMVARTRRLAAAHGVDLEARECRWEDLPAQGFAPFDAVLCVGNSIPHAAGRDARCAALRAMTEVLAPGGRLVVTTRNWELVRATGGGLQAFDEIVERPAGRAVVVYSWWLAEDWDDRHEFDVAVALIGDDGSVRTVGERLPFWPFRHETLDADLRAAGLEPESSTYAGDIDRYLVTARRPS